MPTERNLFGSVRKLPSGKFQARYRIPGTLEYVNAPHTFTRKTDARAWLAQQQADIERGTWIHPEQAKVEAEQARLKAIADALPLDTFAYEWFQENTHSKAHKRAMESQWRNHITPHLGSTPIKQITHQHIATWLRHLTEAGVGAGTRKPCYDHLRRVLSEAVDRDIIDFNPIVGRKYLLTLATSQTASELDAKGRKKAHAPADIRRMLEAVKPEQEAMLWLLACTGMRISELRPLKRGDFDFKANLLHVTHATTGTGVNADNRGRTKTEAGTRSIPLHPAVMSMVRLHCERVGALSSEALLFPKQGNLLECMPAYRVEYALQKACERAGIEYIRPHDLRHSAITIVQAMRGNGVNEADIKSYFGHSKGGDITLRYTHADEERKRLIADTIYGALADSGNVIQLRKAE